MFCLRAFVDIHALTSQTIERRPFTNCLDIWQTDALRDFAETEEFKINPLPVKFKMADTGSSAKVT